MNWIQKATYKSSLLGKLLVGHTDHVGSSEWLLLSSKGRVTFDPGSLSNRRLQWLMSWHGGKQKPNQLIGPIRAHGLSSDQVNTLARSQQKILVLLSLMDIEPIISYDSRAAYRSTTATQQGLHAYFCSLNTEYSVCKLCRNIWSSTQLTSWSMVRGLVS